MMKIENMMLWCYSVRFIRIMIIVMNGMVVRLFLSSFMIVLRFVENVLKLLWKCRNRKLMKFFVNFLIIDEFMLFFVVLFV